MCRDVDSGDILEGDVGQFKVPDCPQRIRSELQNLDFSVEQVESGRSAGPTQQLHSHEVSVGAVERQFADANELSSE